LGSLLADLRAAVEAGRTRDTGLYLQFKALIFLQPEVCPSLAEVLERSAPDGLTADVVGGALGVVGHPEAQAALASALLARRDDPAFVSRIVPFLTMARRPADEAERVLIDLAESQAGADVHSAALFGLGTMARNSRDSDPGRGDRIAARLLSRLRDPMPEAEADLVLKALGNSGSAKALPTLAEYAKDPSAGLRAAALVGLRFVDAPEADGLLAEALRSDPEASVRIASLQAFSFRQSTGETVKAQIGALAGDLSESVRVAALRNLGKSIGAFPEALEAVRRAAENDASENVRKAAAAILAGPKK
jgi:HEAT repeat protein